MKEKREFLDVVAAINAGSQRALDELLEECSPRVYRAIRRKFVGTDRRWFDSDDIAQAVWASFFAQTSLLQRFETLDDLVNFVAVMAQNRLINEVAHRNAQKRGGGRQVDLDSTIAATQENACPTPSRVAASREEWQNLLQERNGIYRDVLELRGQGFSHQEIATQLHMHAGSVRRVIGRCLRLLKSMEASP